MTFYIYRSGMSFSMKQNDHVEEGFVGEAEAADFAIRHAQNNGALYSINYWRP